ncbi:MAG: bifunctional 3-hydroxydecanoyl-ACP dehydratase/trans-2-decenoyl-ACP isomerase [Myxococcota bacterium]
MLTHAEFLGRDSFTKPELLAFAYGRLISDPPEGFRARLPLPPMLMVDRIDHLSAEKSRGTISASRDVRIDDWFFQCHFLDDPVQPGCLGLDGVWQMLGFYCNWRGGIGAGRALGCGEVEFFGQIRPHDGTMRYELQIKRYTELKSAGAAIVIGDAQVLIDDEEIYTVKGARVGLFKGIDYPDYPFDHKNARGGRMER